MSFRKKIIFSFIISAFIIAVLAAFEYYTYVQVKSEMRFLEVTDTLRSKSLQLRRHEKNFFLYPEKAAEESVAIYDYIGQLEEGLKVAEDERCDLIIMGTRKGKGLLRRLLGDNVVGKVTGLAHCPVLVVNA